MSAMTGASSRSALADRAIMYGCVAAGSICGGLLRYLFSVLFQFAPEFPWATLLVNVTGSFIIGFYAAFTGPDGRILASARQRQFVMTGFCGGYTTFSAFSLETFTAWQAGLTQLAAINIGVSVVSWFAAVLLGHVTAGRINRLKGA